MQSTSEKEISLEMLREEYKRLRNRFDALMNSSFEDFKLLAAIGTLIAWPPLATSNLFEPAQEGLVLLVGFIGILFLIAIIGLRDMLKWSIIEFYLQELRLCEQALKTHLASDFQGLQFAHHWPNHYREQYVPVFSRFSLLFVILLILLPGAVFSFRADYLYLAIYFVSFVIVLGLYLSAAKKLGAL